jgi:hypothetical protein
MTQESNIFEMADKRLHIRERWNRRLFAQGRTLRPESYVSHVPDRYGAAYGKYLAAGGSFGKDLVQKYVAGNRYNNSGDLSRFFFLSLACDQLLKEGIRGDTAELGVYRGNTGIFVAKLAEQMGGKAYLFDTFEGFAEQDLAGIDSNKAFEFADTSLEAVKALIDRQSAVYVKGYFPESIAGNVPDDASFCLVHIDCDLYGPCKAALEYFYPRMAPGGFLIMHDYSSLYWDGVENAVDEFFRDKNESLIPVPDKSGTVAIRKCKAPR